MSSTPHDDNGRSRPDDRDRRDDDDLRRFPVRRIPPSHDYIRQHGSGPKDGWTKGPSDPGLGLEVPGEAPTPTGAGRTLGPAAPPCGEVHKFGYTRPLKKHEETDLVSTAPGSCLVPKTNRPDGGSAADSADEPAPFVEGDPPFVHLHVHSNFSFLDGGSRIEELVARAAEIGQTALALTDHDGLYGAVRFAKACSKRGIKPVFGAEVRVESLLAVSRPDGERPRPSDTRMTGCTQGGVGPDDAGRGEPHHLVLLAETREGYANLCRLLSAAHLADPGRENPPFVTLKSLRTHSGGLICLTGCRHGEVGYLIDAGRDREARAVLLRLRDIFGPNHLFVELQYFGYEPHEEAHPGQHGTLVLKKAPAIGNRLRHEPLPAPVAYAPAAPGAAPGISRGPSSTSTPAAVRKKAVLRPDLPHGRPQRLNPSDYDIGFHRDDRPWRISCLTYCLHLAALARACGLPIVLTTNAHYARATDRDIHLICRAAGHDKPLSGYPDPGTGARCLSTQTEIAALAAPLLELIAPEHIDTINIAFLANRNSSSVHMPSADHHPDRGSLMPERDVLERSPVPSTGSVPASVPSTVSSTVSSTVQPDVHPVVRSIVPRPPHGPEQYDASLRVHKYCSATLVASSESPATKARAAPHPNPLDTTWEIAQRCTVDLELGTYHFPQVDVPGGETAYSLLAKRCFRGIARRYRPVPPRAVELLEKELRMIQKMGFAHYFLVVHDIVRWARARGVACSGRGSAGNSIVCHALDITASEPIRHNLLFERFLNPNRREMPDIDVDFCSSRRDEVIEHIYQTFGNENVAVVANVNTMSPRSAVRIVAEALGHAPTEINALAKHVPRHGDAARIREYLAGAWPELHESLLQDESRYGRLLDLVERLDSFPMHLGTHLGGFVIADRPITYYAPLQWAAKGVVVIQFNKDDVAALGLVKMDILGLRTHSAVSETVHIIRQRTGRRIRPYDLPPDDPAAYEIISNGGSIGLFQLESAGQRNLASRLQERDFDDIIAAIALYRPGPLEAEMIGPFIDRRWGLEPVSLPHPDMTAAVADTYGVILYQEQVLRIAQAVAGFDLADADSLRRAMTRDRSRTEMAQIGETFISRAVERGVPEDAAREVFRQLEGFAAYGFNKSHSVCFAVISYATAWLKAHYPAEFLCAVLNNYPMGFYTPRTVLNDARRFGLEVRPIDINLSGRGFTVEDEVPPDPWRGGAATGGESDLFGDAGAGGTFGSYDPFAQAWTAEHGWGLTEADLAELQVEQDGDQAYAEALQAALEQRHEDNRAGSTESGVVPTGRAALPASSLEPRLARSPRSRAGVEPGACLAPSTGIAPDAARALRVGFSYLKQIGDRSLDRIEEERGHGPFESFEDFYLRTRIDYPVAENLIRVGAFDSLEPDRTELLWRLPILHDRLEALAGSTGARRGQLRVFFSPPERTGLERSWSVEDKVRSELELLGLTVSCHPLQLYEDELRRLGVSMSYELPAMGDEVPVAVAGVYERAQNPWMRSGRRTMFLTLEDAYGLFECVCFESKLPKIAPVVARASYFLVRGRLQNNHKRGLAIVAEEVFDLEEVLARRAPRRRPAGAADHPSRGDGRSRVGHPEAIQTRPELRGRRGMETYGDGTVSAKKRPPGAGTSAIPKKVG